MKVRDWGQEKIKVGLKDFLRLRKLNREDKRTPYLGLISICKECGHIGRECEFCSYYDSYDYDIEFPECGSMEISYIGKGYF